MFVCNTEMLLIFIYISAFNDFFWNAHRKLGEMMQMMPEFANLHLHTVFSRGFWCLNQLNQIPEA